MIFRFLHHKTTFFDPVKLIEAGIRVSFTIQYPGDMIICKYDLKIFQKYIEFSKCKMAVVLKIEMVHFQARMVDFVSFL